MDGQDVTSIQEHVVGDSRVRAPTVGLTVHCCPGMDLGRQQAFLTQRAGLWSPPDPWMPEVQGWSPTPTLLA